MPFDINEDGHGGGGGGPQHENLRQLSVTLIDAVAVTSNAVDNCLACQAIDVAAGLINFLAFKIESDEDLDLDRQEAVEAVFEMVRKVEKTWKEQES